MAFTKCPSCRKIQQVVPKLLNKEVACMNTRCKERFDAGEYRMHNGPLSRAVFYFVIGFAVFSTFRWVWFNADRIIYLLT
jgi:hypothetical protein